MIDTKDRSQLLRMAGNIAGGLLAWHPEMKDYPVATYAAKLALDHHIAAHSAKLALDTMREVDKLIAEENGTE